MLPVISRQTVKELARDISLPCIEKDYDLYDAYNSDEAFITSTSFCICPCRSVNGRTFRDNNVPGPITEKLMKSYVDLVGFDWVSQYTRYPAKDVPRL